jgi:hypothetical protein
MGNLYTWLLILFLISNGTISIMGYYFRWNSLISAILFHNEKSHILYDWVWFGTMKGYRELLEKEGKRLQEMLTKEKEKQK